ncbi:hypothetical protein FQN60_003147, partial [Etheostoma spectabile]
SQHHYTPFRSHHHYKTFRSYHHYKTFRSYHANGNSRSGWSIHNTNNYYCNNYTSSYNNKASWPNKASKVWSRSETGVKADVEILFSEQAEITTAQVTETMKAASSGEGVLKGAVFEGTDLCKKKPCDESSTTCKWTDGLSTCTCSNNYIETDFSTKLCIACPSGQKAEGSKKCVNCQFGYSGFNCTECEYTACV